MYKEIVINDIVAKLASRFTTEELQAIKIQIEISLTDYTVLKYEKQEIIPYEYTIPEEIKYFIISKKIEGKSDKTLENYYMFLKNFFQEVQKPLDEITSGHIRVYLYTYQQKRAISNRSLEVLRNVFNSFFTWAFNEGYIKTNPMLKIGAINYDPKPREGLTQLELEKVREACADERDRAIIEFLYSTGCRISEVCNVKISDINFQQKTCLILGKGNKYRTVYLNAKCELALDRYLKTRNDNTEYLFVGVRRPHNQLHKSGMEAIVKKIVKRTDINKNITPHMFRHTMATTALQNGMTVPEVQKILGHTNIETTMIYVRTDDEELRLKAKKLIN